MEENHKEIKPEDIWNDEKREKIKEAAKKLCESSHGEGYYPDVERGFIEGVKWQEERMYSEEEVLIELNRLMTMSNSELDLYTNDDGFVTKEWFEQFKRNNYDTMAKTIILEKMLLLQA